MLRQVPRAVFLACLVAGIWLVGGLPVVLAQPPPSPDLFLTKSDSPDPVLAGNNLTYTVSLGNTVDASAFNVVLTDAVPASTTFVSFVAPAGWTALTPPIGGTGNVTANAASFGGGLTVAFTLVVKVNASTLNGSTIVNSVSVTSSNGDLDPSDNTASAITAVVTQADLLMTKVANSFTAGPGEPFLYTINVVNNGPSDAQSVTLSDALPANTTFVSVASPPSWTMTTPPPGGTGTITATRSILAAGAGATFSFAVNVSAATPNGTGITNTATVTSTTADPNAANNTASVTTTVTNQADLAVSKSDSPDPVNAGTNLTYTLSVSNGGPNPAANLSLSDPIPLGTTFVSATQTTGPAFTLTTPAVGGTGTVIATIASLASGASATFSIVVNVTATTPNNSVISNRATVVSDSSDPNNANNTASATSTVNNQADLSVTKADSPDPVMAGGNITYTLTVINSGPYTAAGAYLSDFLPAATTLVSFNQTSGPPFSCSEIPGGIYCVIASLPAGVTAGFSLVVSVPAGTANGTLISNYATANSATVDPNYANNTATATTTVIGLTAPTVTIPTPIVPSPRPPVGAFLGPLRQATATPAAISNAQPAGVIQPPNTGDTGLLPRSGGDRQWVAITSGASLAGLLLLRLWMARQRR